MVEILDGLLPNPYHEKLEERTHDIYDESTSKTIAVLRNVEPSIHKMQKLLQQGKDAANKGGKKRRMTDDNNNHDKANGGGNGTRVACKHCGKMHAGKCWSLDENKSGGRGNGNGRGGGKSNSYGGRGNKNEKIYSMMSSLQSEIKDLKEASNNNNKPEWANNMATDEHLYVLGRAQGDQDCSDDDVSVDLNKL